MHKGLYVFLLVVSGLFPFAGLAGDAAETEPTPVLDPVQIVEGLPWTFEIGTIDASGEHDTSAAGVGSIRYDFTSTEPYNKTAQGKRFLRAELEITRYDSREVADAAYRRLLADAHPDMGLSYAWDRVILAAGALFHLHAGCTFSESSFGQMAGRLDALVRQPDDGAGDAFFCRCGGGCRAD
jgi:hypothetical protein